MNNKALSAAIALLLGVSGIISGCSEKLAVSKEDSEVSTAKNSEAEEKTDAPELSRKDKIYQEYLSSQKLCNVSKEFKILEAGTAKDNPEGLAVAVKYDFDKDGKDELVTFTFDRNSTNGEDIRIDLLKLKGKSLEVADSRFITEMADLSNQPKQDSIYFADAATTEIVTSEYNGQLYIGLLFSKVYDDINRGGDINASFSVLTIDDDSIEPQSIGQYAEAIESNAMAKLLPPSIRDTADIENNTDSESGSVILYHSSPNGEKTGLFESPNLAFSNMLNEFGLDIESKQYDSDYTTPDFHWVSKNQSKIKQILNTEYLYPYNSRFSPTNFVFSDFYAGIKLILDSDLEELLENQHLFDGITEDETKLYTDILHYPYYYREIWDTFDQNELTAEYFIADINDDYKKELVLIGKSASSIDSIAAVKPDMSIVKTENIGLDDSDLYFYDSGIIAVSEELLGLSSGECCYINSNTGEVITVALDTDNNSKLHMISSIDPDMNIVGEAIADKEITLENGTAYHPETNSCSTDYSPYNPTEIVVIEDNRDITYSSWQEAYIDTINDYVGDSNKGYDFSLIFIDNDDVPELYIYKTEGMLEYILTYKNGRVLSVFGGGYRTFVTQYIEKEGIFLKSVAYPNSYYADEIYKLSDSKVTELCVKGTEIDMDEATQISVYRVNGNDTGEDECNKEFEKYSDFKEINMICTYDEVIRVLNGETVNIEPATKPTAASEEVNGASTDTGAESHTATVKANGGLNMRSGAGKDFSKVTLIPDGSTVEVVEESGEWSLVKYNSYTGWVKSSYLR